MTIAIKRAYDEPADDDGLRVLVDRLWPRGVRKADAAIDEWAKDATPSTELRQWFHDNGDFEAFSERYVDELEHGEGGAALAVQLAGHDRVTFVTAVHDPESSHATVLRDWIEARG